MAIDQSRVKAVIFDYGNTLIEFVARHADHCLNALAAGLESEFGPVDRALLKTRCDAHRMKPYQGDYRENDVAAFTQQLVRELYDCDATPTQIYHLMHARRKAFVDVIEAPDFVHGFLHRMQSCYPLAMISNFPCGQSLRESLARTGIDQFMQAVVVSGDLGFVKPHPVVFETILDQLNIQPDQAVYIGDNWLGDIQGSKKLGMQAVFICQYNTLEVFEPKPGDLQPDLTIHHLLELEDHL